MRASSILVAGAASLALAAPAHRKRASNFQFFGINESGPEFGTSLPGTLGTDYVWPTLSTIDTFIAKGMNTFRVNILMERLTQNTMTATSMDSDYLADLKETVNYITNAGAYAMICPHNYGRFESSVITDISGFQTWWTNVAAEFANNTKVIFDTNNEYHDMDQSVVVELNQAAINGIRAAGATSQYITVEGNSYTGAWSWVSSGNGATMGNLTDTEDKLIYQMHQYLDSDSSGTSETCVSTTIGAERLEAATAWLRENNKLGLIGEYAAGVNDDCKEAIEGMLGYMSNNTDVWTGALWWAAGPWWGTYMYSMEPTDGLAYTGYLDTIMAYA